MSAAVRLLLVGAPLLAVASALPAQQSAAGGRAPPLRVSSAVAPETVTVGDRFRSVLQVVAPAGATVEFSPLPVADALQPADSLRVIPGRAGEPPIAAYSLVAWIAGAPLDAQVSVRVARPDGSAATYLVPLRLPVVRSVLPADTAGVRPRPARGVLELDRPAKFPWPWLLAGLLGAAAALGAWLFRRRGRAPAAAARTPRERALAELDRLARDSGSGGPSVLYPRVTRVLRHFVAELSPQWGLDLTTSELMDRMQQGGAAAEHREPLRALLQHADRVKFARYAPRAEEVDRFLAAARAWVRDHPGEADAPDEREAA